MDAMDLTAVVRRSEENSTLDISQGSLKYVSYDMLNVRQQLSRETVS